MNADARVMEFYPAPLTDAESQALMERIRSEFPTEGFGLYAVERLSDNELLGFVELHRVTCSGELAGQIEIGWRLRRDTWGQGYATEAARACIAHAAKLGIPELISFTYVGNRRSLNVMKRLGMEYAGEFDHPALPEGHPLRRHAPIASGLNNEKVRGPEGSRTSLFRRRNHFNSNSTVPRISSDAAPTQAVNAPGSATHAPFASS